MILARFNLTIIDLFAKEILRKIKRGLLVPFLETYS